MDLNFKIRKKKYWKPKFNINYEINCNDVREVQSLLDKSMNYRMRSDVPIAFCLSGGIDSGYLFSLGSKISEKKINSFSIIDHDVRYNELSNIEALLKNKNTKNNKINIAINKKNFFERINEITKYQDSPISTISYYIHSYLSENISNNKFRIAISGTGADEFFTGYYDHFLLQLATINKTNFYKQKLLEWKKYIKPIIRNEYLKNHEVYIKNPNNRSLVFEKGFNLNESKIIRKCFIKKKYCNELLRNRMLNELFHGVPCILKDDDHNSMIIR